jgi:hypothetical protein
MALAPLVGAGVVGAAAKVIHYLYGDAYQKASRGPKVKWHGYSKMDPISSNKAVRLIKNRRRRRLKNMKEHYELHHYDEDPLGVPPPALTHKLFKPIHPKPTFVRQEVVVPRSRPVLARLDPREYQARAEAAQIWRPLSYYNRPSYYRKRRRYYRSIY